MSAMRTDEKGLVHLSKGRTCDEWSPMQDYSNNLLRCKAALADFSKLYTKFLTPSFGIRISVDKSRTDHKLVHDNWKWLSEFRTKDWVPSNASTFVTPLLVEQVAMICERLDEYRKGKYVKSVLPVHGNYKSGKSRYIQHCGLIASICDYVQTKERSYPFVLLTSRNEGEDQLCNEVDTLEQFARSLRVEAPGVQTECLSDYIDYCRAFVKRVAQSISGKHPKAKVGEWWVKRTGGSTNRDYFLAFANMVIRERAKCVILPDEWDEGCDAEQLLTRWFDMKLIDGRTIFDHLHDRTGTFKIVTFSGSANEILDSVARDYPNCPVDNVVRLETERYYRSVEDVPVWNFQAVMKQIGLPEDFVHRLAMTNCSGDHPFVSLVGYIRYFYKLDLQKLRGREKQEFLEDKLADPETQMAFALYKKKFPIDLARFFEAFWKDRSTKGYRWISARVVVENDATVELVGFLRNRLKSWVVIPYCHAKDTFLGESIDWLAKGQPSDVIRYAFEALGEKQWSRPVIMLTTATDRRTTESPDDRCSIVFGRSWSTHTAKGQEEGRNAGNFKKRSEMILTPMNKAHSDGSRAKIDTGLRLHRAANGSPFPRTKRKTDITIEESDVRSLGNPVLDKFSRSINDLILNRPYMIEKIQDKISAGCPTPLLNTIKGGEIAFEQSYGDGRAPMANWYYVFTDVVRDAITKNYSHFLPELAESPLLEDFDKTTFPASEYRCVCGSERNKTYWNGSKICRIYDPNKMYAFVGIRSAAREGSMLHKTANTKPNQGTDTAESQIFYAYDEKKCRMYWTSLVLRLKKSEVLMHSPITPKVGSLAYRLAVRQGEED